MNFIQKLLKQKTKFVLISTQRSGTTLLSEYLASHKNIYMGKELFKTSGEGRNKDIDSYILGESVKDFLHTFYKTRLKSVQACGFKVMLDQLENNPEILTYIERNKITCIYMERKNILNTATSRLMARKRNIYHIDQPIILEAENLDIDTLLLELNILNETHQKLQKIATKCDAETIYYEDLVQDKDSVLTNILHTLHLPQTSRLESSLQKINSSDMRKVIKNYNAIEDALRKTKFNYLLPKKSLYNTFNDTHKTLFIHIPKVAGSSIEKSMFGTKGQIGHHTAIDFYRNDSEKFTAYYSFAFVRHPLDRFVSAYEYLKQGGRNKFDQAWAEENILPHKSFKSFVKSLNNEKQREHILNWMHFKPQYLFVCDEDKNILINFIGKYENLENDFNTIADTLSLDVVLPHENKTTQRKTYQEYYDSETLQIIYKVYAHDFELFNYSVS